MPEARPGRGGRVRDARDARRRGPLPRRGRAFPGLDADLVVTQDLCAVCAVDVSVVDDALAHLGARGPPSTRTRSTRCSPRWRRWAGPPAARRMRPPLVRRRYAGASTTSYDGPRGSRGPGPWSWSGPTRRSPSGTGCRRWSRSRAATRSSARPARSRSGWTGSGEYPAPEVVVCAPARASPSTALAEQVVAAGVLADDVPVWAVDANASFARPGPRAADGVEALAGILHPGAVTEPTSPWPAACADAAGRPAAGGVGSRGPGGTAGPAG